MTFLPFLLNRSRLPICSYNLFLFWPVTLKSVKKKKKKDLWIYICEKKNFKKKKKKYSCINIFFFFFKTDFVYQYTCINTFFFNLLKFYRPKEKKIISRFWKPSRVE